MAPPTSGLSSSSTLKPKSIGKFTTFSHAELQKKLEGAGTPFESDASKVELQALWVMTEAGLLNKERSPGRELLDKWTKGCSMTVPQLSKLLSKTKGLKDASQKWEQVEVLMNAEIAKMNVALNQMSIGESSTPVGPGAKNQPAVAQRLPEPGVVNLLISAIYGEATRTGTVHQLPGCPVKTAKSLKGNLDQIGEIKTAASLTASLKSPKVPSQILSWICSTYGHDIVLAPEHLRIPAFPQDVHQFVVIQPNATLQEKFSYHMKAKASASTVLFHGTPLFNLLSILRDGFHVSVYGDGLWLAENPSYSCRYAMKDSSSPYLEWSGSPYTQYGALLGCEAAGKGSELEEGIHLVSQPKTVIVRYIFLLPNDPNGASQYLTRANVEPAMRDAFAHIRTVVASNS